MTYTLYNPHPSIACIWDVAKDIPPAVDLSRLSPNSYLNPVRNLSYPYLFFTQSQLFSPAAEAFRQAKKREVETGIKACYTYAPQGCKEYLDFWMEERKRCLEGYEPLIDDTPCGVRITGEHYFYLNYCVIERRTATEEGKVIRKELEFPQFLSMDFYYFLELEKNEIPRKPEDKCPMLVLKSRRKGWSFKNAGGAVHKYSFFPQSYILIVSEEEEKANNTFNYGLAMIDFLNEYTEFRQPIIHRRAGQNENSIKSGWIETNEYGIEVEKGKRCRIETRTLKNKPHNTVGSGITRLIVEEAGLVEKLIKAFRYGEPTLRDGEFWTGMMLLYGTGGDFDSRAVKEFSEMFYNPKGFKLAAYDNIWSKDATNFQTGYFVDEMWYRPGSLTLDGKVYEAVDKNGNAHRWVAEILLDAERPTVTGNKQAKKAFVASITQKCKTPEEAFMIADSTVFPAEEIYTHLSDLIARPTPENTGTAGRLIHIGKEVIFEPDLEGHIKPVEEFPCRDEHPEGAIVIYESPKKINGLVPKGAYIVSMDPIELDEEGGTSLIAIYVLKTKKYAIEIGYDEFVACYVGRPARDPIDTANRYMLNLALYYNADVTHENDRIGKTIRDFFIKNNAYHLLLPPPAAIVGKHSANSKTLTRITGHSMATEELKEIGELYFFRFLTAERLMPDGSIKKNYQLIKDKGLLRELISYSRKKNCDRVLACFGAVLQERSLFNEFKDHQQPKPPNPNDFFFNRTKYEADKKTYQKQLKDHPVIPELYIKPSYENIGK